VGSTSVAMLDYWQALAVIVVFGGFGGVASSIFDNFDNFTGQNFIEHSCQNCNSAYFFRRAIIGVAGSFCAVFLGIWLGKFTIEATVNNLLYLSSFCVAIGTISFTILPQLGKKIGEQILAEKIAQNEKKAEATEKKVDIAIENSNANLNYTRVMLHAETALNTKHQSDIDTAIENLKNIQSKYKRDRTLNIYLGRLYRVRQEYDDAINLLRSYIDEIESNPDMFTNRHDNVDKADAYYNIACYHALKAKQPHDDQQEYERLITEAFEAFQTSIQLSHNNLEYAKRDEDLKWLLGEDDRFKELKI
jgi:tetratricopeptide (TPR) repeat protein